MPLLAAAKGFPQGEFQLSTFDPFSLTIEQMQVLSSDSDLVKTDQGKQVGHRLSIVLSGVATTMWVASDGSVLREEETGGMMMVATDMQSALDIPDVEIDDDILVQLAVPCHGKIDDPRKTRYMKAEIWGLAGTSFDLDDDFQTVLSRTPLIVEMHPAHIDSSVIIKRQDFLRSEAFLQVDDPNIVETSRSITQSATSSLETAEMICNWVFANIEKDYVVSVPSAVDVLRTRKGDCNEHTSLFTALARAAGLPTKICVGLVYKDGLFFYHAWPAVHVGGGWHPMDPALGQTKIDATHIKLLEGGLDRQADLIKLVGKLSVRILGVSSADYQT